MIAVFVGPWQDNCWSPFFNTGELRVAFSCGLPKAFCLGTTATPLISTFFFFSFKVEEFKQGRGEEGSVQGNSPSAFDHGGVGSWGLMAARVGARWWAEEPLSSWLLQEQGLPGPWAPVKNSTVCWIELKWPDNRPFGKASILAWDNRLPGSSKLKKFPPWERGMQLEMESCLSFLQVFSLCWNAREH